jgi:hypothetical protein
MNSGRKRAYPRALGLCTSHDAGHRPQSRSHPWRMFRHSPGQHKGRFAAHSRKLSGRRRSRGTSRQSDQRFRIALTFERTAKRHEIDWRNNSKLRRRRVPGGGGHDNGRVWPSHRSELMPATQITASPNRGRGPPAPGKSSRRRRMMHDEAGKFSRTSCRNSPTDRLPRSGR